MKRCYKEKIENSVRKLYWSKNYNCAITTLIVLSDIYEIKLNKQVLNGAIGLNGAGKYRAQCGIVEGGLIFLGIWGTINDITANTIENRCYNFAFSFEKEFGSLKCVDLRPEGFMKNNLSHLCEKLTTKGLVFIKEYIDKLIVDGFNIRNAIYSDFDGVFSLLKQLWPDLELDYNKLKYIYKNGVDSKVQKLIVGIIDNKIIGFCSLTIKNNLWQGGNLGFIDELVIDEVYRGKGYGKKMIDSITQIAKDMNCKWIELGSGFHRTEAHKFYESLGFKKRAYKFSKRLS